MNERVSFCFFLCRPLPSPAPFGFFLLPPPSSIDITRYFGNKPVVQPAFVIREESVLPKADLTSLQKKGAGPEALLVVCKACAENCFVPGRVSFGSRMRVPPTTPWPAVFCAQLVSAPHL